MKTTKNKGGRPKIQGGLRPANVLLQEAQYEKLKELADKSGSSINLLVRKAVESFLVLADKGGTLVNLVAHHIIIYPHPKVVIDEKSKSVKEYDQWFVERFHEKTGLTVTHVATGYTCNIDMDNIIQAKPESIQLNCQIVFNRGVRFVPLSTFSHASW